MAQSQSTSSNPCRCVFFLFRLWKEVVLCGVFLLLFSLYYNPAFHSKRPIDQFDGANYFAHAATVALDFDWDYSNEITSQHMSTNGRVHSNHVGAGWLAAPIMAAFSTIDRIQGHPVLHDRNQTLHSWTRFSFLFAGNLYFLIGVILYCRIATWISPTLPTVCTLILVLSSGIGFFVLHRYAFSHSFEFFVLALAVWIGMKLWVALMEDGKRESLLAFLCGVFAAYAIVVRYNTLNALWLVPTLFCIALIVHPEAKAKIVAALPRISCSYILGAIVGYLPLAVFSLHFFGTIYPNISQSNKNASDLSLYSGGTLSMIGTTLGNVVHLHSLLLSDEYGILFTNPVLPIGTTVLLVWLFADVLRKRNLISILAFIGTLCYFGLHFAIVLYSRINGASYGFRHLLALFPLAFIGVLLAHRYFEGKTFFKGWRGGVLLLLPLMALGCFGIVSSLLFRTTPELSHKREVNVFGKLSEGGNREYLRHVRNDAPKPSTWYRVASMRYPRLVMDGIFDIPALRALLPETIQKRYGSYPMYRGLPFVAHLQAAIIFLMWVIAGIIVARAGREKVAETPEA